MLTDAVRTIPLFSGVDPKLINTLYQENKIKVRQYAKGTAVHSQHEPCETLDIVITGSLAAYSLSDNGSILDMFTFKSGAIVGANLLFGRHGRYPLNITSRTACTLVLVSRAAVLELLYQYPFVIEYVKALSVNAQGVNQKITMMVQHTLRENLLDYLQKQSATQGTSVITLPVSKKQLADHLGVQRPSLFRELKKLKDEGLIEVRNREITLRF